MDITFPSRRLTAAALVGGALVMGVGFAVTPWETERTTVAYHDALAAQPTRAQVAAILLYASYLLLAMAAFGLVAAAGGRGGWWTRIGAVVAVVGMVTLPGLLITDAYDLALAQEVGRGTSVRVSDAAHATALGGIMGAAGGAGLILGSIALVVGLWRAGEVAGGAPVLVVAGWAVPLIAFDVELMLLGAALFAMGCAVVAAGLTGFARRTPAAWPASDGSAP